MALFPIDFAHRVRTPFDCEPEAWGPVIATYTMPPAQLPPVVAAVEWHPIVLVALRPAAEAVTPCDCDLWAAPCGRCA